MRRWFFLCLAASTAIACASVSSEDLEHVGTRRAPLKASAVTPIAQVTVKGDGAVDVETTYLPKVVCCENGAAHPEALKAQAVMARTYMYFEYYESKLGTAAKPFSGTPADQVYNCSLTVSDACRAAVEATHDQVMTFDVGGTTFANVGFFIDGPRPACLAKKSCTCPTPAADVTMTPADHPACDCFTFASQGAANPAYLTYNWTKTGKDVAGSTLGNPANESNHGCGSQNIQSCLGYAGWSYRDMLRFFYGQDIALTAVDGSAVSEDPPAATAAPVASAAPASSATPAAPAVDDGGCSAAPARRGAPRDLYAALLACALVSWAAGRRARSRPCTRS